MDASHRSRDGHGKLAVHLTRSPTAVEAFIASGLRDVPDLLDEDATLHRERGPLLALCARQDILSERVVKALESQQYCRTRPKQDNGDDETGLMPIEIGTIYHGRLNARSFHSTIRHALTAWHSKRGQAFRLLLNEFDLKRLGSESLPLLATDPALVATLAAHAYPSHAVFMNRRIMAMFRGAAKEEDKLRIFEAVAGHKVSVDALKHIKMDILRAVCFRSD